MTIEKIIYIVLSIYAFERVVATYEVANNPLNEDKYIVSQAQIDSIGLALQKSNEKSERFEKAFYTQGDWIKNNFEQIKNGEIDSIKASEVTHENLERIADSLNALITRLSEN